MRIAERYILRELLGPMVFGVAAFVSILVAGRPLMELTKLAFEGVSMGNVVKLFLLLLPPLIVLTLPMSMLLATLLGFGRLSGDSEMVAMYAGGLSLYRAAVPVVFLALLVTLLTVTLNERIVPWSIDQANALRDQIEGQVGEQKDVEIQLPQYAGGHRVATVTASSFSPKTGEMRNVSAFEYTNGVPSRVIHADSAVHVKETDWLLRNGWYQDLGPKGKTPLAMFKEWHITIQQSTEDIKPQKKPAEMSMAELRRAIKTHHQPGLPIATAEYEVAYWNRWAVPFASVVFAMIGMPLGLRPQRASGGLGLGLSIVIIFLYWVVWDYASKLGGLGEMSPFVASWLANFLGVGIGVALLARAPK